MDNEEISAYVDQRKIGSQVHSYVRMVIFYPIMIICRFLIIK